MQDSLVDDYIFESVQVRTTTSLGNLVCLRLFETIISSIYLPILIHHARQFTRCLNIRVSTILNCYKCWEPRLFKLLRYNFKFYLVTETH